TELLELSVPPPPPPLHLDVGVAIRALRHPLRDTDHHPLSNGRRHGEDQLLSDLRPHRHRSARRVFTLPRGNEMVRGSFETKEAENCRQGCQPDSALTEARRVQPGFVEF